MLVDLEEVKGILAHLDESFLLDSERFRSARGKVIADFTSLKVRPCSHCGQAYPKDPLELKKRLDEILAEKTDQWKAQGKIKALIAPHIDLSAGHRIYSTVYQRLRDIRPTRIILLGVGHHISEDLFSLTDKDFETPLGLVENDQIPIKRITEKAKGLIAVDDFEHRSEHSIEFQVIFLQHILRKGSFKIIPILCGPIKGHLPEYNRDYYLEKTGPFLEELRKVVTEQDEETLLVAGVDFSHIGPKFGHEMPAAYLQSQSEEHDKRLLKYLSILDAEGFWKESIKVDDRFNVCGFSALACLLEVLESCSGEVLDYQVWHEEATRSAVGFGGVVFTS